MSGYVVQRDRVREKTKTFPDVICHGLMNCLLVNGFKRVGGTVAGYLGEYSLF